jgi:hypothetical protein
VLLSWPARWRPEQFAGMVSRLEAAMQRLSARASRPQRQNRPAVESAQGF